MNHWIITILIVLPLLGAILNGFLLSWIGWFLDVITRWCINRIRLLGLISTKVKQFFDKRYPDRERLPGIRNNLTTKETAHTLAVGLIFATFLLAIFIYFYYLSPILETEPKGFIKYTLWRWIDLGTRSEFDFEFSLRIDPLSFVMILVVTGVGSIIHLYSIGYMAEDPGYRRFFTYMNLFIFFMLLLVMADNLIVMYIGWEGVGLCSYLLIGFWYEDILKAKAGKKAFIVNRIGDIGFLIGILIIAYATHSIDWEGIKEGIKELISKKVFGLPLSTISALLLFLGACGKSAQIPLYIWLPDAMAGPTPVSALIHAATMVTAGVYMIVRLHFLYITTPGTLAIISGIGIITALFSGIIAIAQNNIKKILAYSTISQLGYMFLGVGVGGFTSAIFHLVTHSFFKASLFLSAGIVIHAFNGKQDLRELGGIKKLLSISYWTFLISTLAIISFPFTSGFFSKDEILTKTYFSHIYNNLLDGKLSWLSKFYFFLGVLGSFITSFYMIRLFMLIFEGRTKLRSTLSREIKKPSFSMKLSTILLSILSIIGGIIGLPHYLKLPNIIDEWLSKGSLFPIIETITSKEIYISLLSTVISLSGAYLAYIIYKDPELKLANKFIISYPRIYRTVYNKFWVDEIYERTVVKLFNLLSIISYQLLDRLIIDGIVNLLAESIFILSSIFRYILHSSGKIQRYIMFMLLGMLIILFYIAYPVTDIKVEVDNIGGVYFKLPAYPGYKFKFDFDGDGKWDKVTKEGEKGVYKRFLPGVYDIKIEITNNWGITVTKRIKVILEE